MQQRVDGGEGCGIHQLHDRRLRARRGDGGGCLGGRPHVGEGRRDRADLAGNESAELQRGADDDAERALGADDERGEVEPGDALDGAVPEPQQAAVGEHEVDAEHGVAHDAVLRAQQAAGAGRDVAADRGDGAARGIGRPPQRRARPSAALRSALRMPGSTTASRSSGRTSRMRSMPRIDRAISPAPAFAPPARPVPAPRVTTGVPVAVAMRSVACTSATDAACTTARGLPDAACPDLSARASSTRRRASCRRDRRARRAAARATSARRRSREPAAAGEDARGHGDDAEDETDPGEPHAPPRHRRRDVDEQLDDRADERVHGEHRARRDEQRPDQDRERPVRRSRRRCSTGTATSRSPRSRGSRTRRSRTRRRGHRRPTAGRACRVRAAPSASRVGCRTWPPFYGRAQDPTPAVHTAATSSASVSSTASGHRSDGERAQVVAATDRARGRRRERRTASASGTPAATARRSAASCVSVEPAIAPPPASRATPSTTSTAERAELVAPVGRARPRPSHR